MKTITFKSTPENWLKEYLNIKSNTVRRFDDDADLRKEILDDFACGNYYSVTLQIVNTHSNEFFKRIISDVTIFEGLYIISWQHT